VRCGLVLKRDFLGNMRCGRNGHLARFVRQRAQMFEISHTQADRWRAA
jgi:hypothetical protein